jgi:NTP pyrophosphatase (non-canonical NTP hydrolase)
LGLLSEAGEVAGKVKKNKKSFIKLAMEEKF